MKREALPYKARIGVPDQKKKKIIGGSGRGTNRIEETPDQKKRKPDPNEKILKRRKRFVLCGWKEKS